MRHHPDKHNWNLSIVAPMPLDRDPVECSTHPFNNRSAIRGDAAGSSLSSRPEIRTRFQLTSRSGTALEPTALALREKQQPARHLKLDKRVCGRYVPPGQCTADLQALPKRNCRPK